MEIWERKESKEERCKEREIKQVEEGSKRKGKYGDVRKTRRD